MSGEARLGATRDWQVVLWPFLLSRLWMAAFVYLGHAQQPYREAVPGGWEGVDNWWLNPWTTFDSKWYLRIAQDGYEPETVGFSPFYPWLLRLAGSDMAALAAWGVLLSNLAFAGGLLALYRLTARDYDRRTAQLTVWLLAFYPATFVFSAVYTEAIFLWLLVGTYAAVRDEKWGWAALCAVLAALTRNVGLILGAALLCEWWQKQRTPASPRPRHWPLLALALLPLLTFALWQVYLSWRFADPLAGVKAYQLTFRQFSAPWVPLWRDVADIVTGKALDIVTLLNVAVTVATLVLVWLHRRRQPLSYGALMLGVMLLHLTYARIVPPYTNGSLRYMATAFPFVQLLAWHALPLIATRFRLIIFALGYSFVCALMSYMFGLRTFASG